MKADTNVIFWMNFFRCGITALLLMEHHKIYMLLASVECSVDLIVNTTKVMPHEHENRAGQHNLNSIMLDNHLESKSRNCRPHIYSKTLHKKRCTINEYHETTNLSTILLHRSRPRS